MALFDQHPDEDELEMYSLRRLPEEREARVEEHILICEDCLEKVKEIDEFVEALRAAAADRRIGLAVLAAEQMMAAATQLTEWKVGFLQRLSQIV